MKITMQQFGRMGQWGNQVFQYAFIRTYAKRLGIDYELPSWAGQYFFGHADPPITASLPKREELREPASPDPVFGVPIPPWNNELVDRDFCGWAQYHTSWYAPDRSFITSLFDVVSPERERVAPLMERLRNRGDTIISLHLRRGDSGRMIFFFTPIVWCLKWLHENWDSFCRPVLFLSTEDVSLVRHFARYLPVTVEDLGITIGNHAPPHYIYPYGSNYSAVRQVDFFPDWYILQQSDVILASDSTFSVSAAWVSRTVLELWRPRLSLQAFELLDPWNMPTSSREHLDNFPGIPGTQIDSNQKFWGDWKPRHPSVQEDPDVIASWEQSYNDANP